MVAESTNAVGELVDLTLPLVSLFRKVRGKLETKWARLPGGFCWIADGRKVRGFDG